jgi:hypothetical protein
MPSGMFGADDVRSHLLDPFGAIGSVLPRSCVTGMIDVVVAML